MAKKTTKRRRPQAAERVQTELPPGVKLLRTFEGHGDTITSLAFDPQGDTLASASRDLTVKLWEPSSGKLLRTLEGHGSSIFGLAFDSRGNILASGSSDASV